MWDFKHKVVERDLELGNFITWYERVPLRKRNKRSSVSNIINTNIQGESQIHNKWVKTQASASEPGCVRPDKCALLGPHAWI